MNKVYKQKELKVFYMENKVVLIAVVENRVKERNAPTDPRGRIWVMWDPSVVDFNVINIHHQIIYGYVNIL